MLFHFEPQFDFWFLVLLCCCHEQPFSQKPAVSALSLEGIRPSVAPCFPRGAGRLLMEITTKWHHTPLPVGLCAGCKHNSFVLLDCQQHASVPLMPLFCENDNLLFLRLKHCRLFIDVSTCQESLKQPGRLM